MNIVNEHPFPTTKRTAEITLEMGEEFCGSCKMNVSDDMAVYCALFEEELGFCIDTGIFRGDFPVYKDATKTEPHNWHSYRRSAKCREMFK